MLTPLPADQWNRATAAHLLNRAGFGGTPAEIDKLTALGLHRAVDSLVNPPPDNTPLPDTAWSKPDPDAIDRRQKIRQMATEQEKKAAQQMERRNQREELGEIRDWWLHRMVSSPDPLREKMTLFWHGHFATSAEKVKLTYFMYNQNATQRRMAMGKWYDMLIAMAQDPAMLVYLDNAKSTKDKPNENFAREVMELFSLGEGHYTEDDIKNGARAFTGWSLGRDRQSFEMHPILHDNGGKKFFDLTGNLDGKDIIGAIVEKPQASKFISAKVWSFFAQQDPSEQMVGALAEAFDDGGKEFGPFLRTMFMSAAFYQPEIVRSQVKSPVQWLVSTVKLLEIPLPPQQMTERALRSLGQELFAPPNVKGWDGGLAWITTSNLLNRYNYAAALVEGRTPELAKFRKKAPGAKQDLSNDAIEDFFAWVNTQAPHPAKAPDEFDKMMMTEEEERKASAMAANPPAMEGGNEMADGRRPANVYPSRRLPYVVEPEVLLGPAKDQTVDGLIASLQTRFIQGELRPARVAELRQYLASVPKIGREEMRHAIQIILASPEYQLT